MKDHDHIATLKAATDPLRVAVALGLQGNRGNRFFCPSCQSEGGKTPDLVIGDKGFTCHKCGGKGDLIDLIIFAQGITFPDAVRWLETFTGTKPSDYQKKGSYHPKGSTPIVDPGASYKVKSILPDYGGTILPDPAIFEAFLSACRPVEGRALDWLVKERGVKEEVVIALGLRLCGREYKPLIASLTERFGEDALKEAGLVKWSDKANRLVPSFWHYYAKKAVALVIPYLKDGRPVYLKVRPPISKEEANRRELVRFLNTAAAVPCLYNVDALKGHPGRVLICEGESDTWAALSNGFPAVGSPGAKGFKSSWVESFRGVEDAAGRSRVYLVMDADKAGEEGSLVIADLFLKAGLPIPLKILLPPGMDLTDYMKREKT